MNTVSGCCVVLAMMTAMSAAAGDPVYRYTDADGVVHYTDRAPDRHAKPLDLAPLSGTTPSRKPTFYSPEALRQAARFAVRIESPTPDQRLPQGRLPLIAAASVMPALVSGFHLVYQVDGRSISGAPVDDLSIPMGPLTPGPHDLVVVLFDADGRELARSPATAFQVVGLSLAGKAPK